MKKLLTLCSTAILASCSSTDYTVTGQIEGLDGKIYLSLLEGKIPVVFDSTTVQAGQFTIQGTLAQASMAQIEDSTHRRIAFFALEPAVTTTINGALAQPDSIAIVGGKEQAVWLGSLDAEIDSLKRLVAANPKSVAAAYVLFRNLSYRMVFDEMRAAVAAFDTTIQKTSYLKLVSEKAELLGKTAVGKPYVDFSAPDTKGTPVALSSVVGKNGQWVLLNFWAGWCAPCRAESPALVKAFNTFKGRGFTIFAASLDNTREQWLSAIAKDGLGRWTNVSDMGFWDSEGAALYGVVSISANVLISPEGVIVARDLHGDNLFTVLDEKLPKAGKK